MQTNTLRKENVGLGEVLERIELEEDKKEYVEEEGGLSLGFANWTETKTSKQHGGCSCCCCSALWGLSVALHASHQKQNQVFFFILGFSRM